MLFRSELDEPLPVVFDAGEEPHLIEHGRFERLGFVEDDHGIGAERHERAHEFLEGVEHLVNPVAYIRELSRIVRPGGHIVLSTPNVMNFWSRLHFLFTGAYYQFNPAAVPELKPDEAADRGHVFPLSYFQLRYLFGEHGVDVVQTMGDKYKRKLLFPLYCLLLPAAWLATRSMLLRQGDPSAGKRNRELTAHALSAPLLFSRSLVLVLKRRLA